MNNPEKAKISRIKISIIAAILLILLISIASTSAAQDAGEDKKIKKDKEVDIKDKKIIESKGKGMVKFNNEINVEAVDVEENLNVYIQDNLIAINTEELPELNQPAAITLYNLFSEDTPAIYYNEGFTTNPSEVITPCPEDVCSNVNYDTETGILTFDVSHFSTYAAYSWGRVWDWYRSSWHGSCFSDNDCKPTAFCAKEIDYCWSSYSPFIAGGYSWGARDVKQCWYFPAAGARDATCIARQQTIIDYDGDGLCPEGFEKIYGNGYYDFKICRKTGACSTCEETEACQRHYCFVSYWNNCWNECSSSSDCGLKCSDEAYENCGGSSAWNNRGAKGIDWGTPEVYHCQPKVCDAEDVEVGLCYYEGDGYNREQNVLIGGKICADKKQWQVCVEDDGDPCGEWEILEDDETKVTTTDMYGLNDFTVDVCAGNSPPEINNIYIIKQNADVCDDLACEAEISDDCSDSFEVEYKITGGHGSLSKTMPEIAGTTTCSGNPCRIAVPIPKQYTTCSDVIKCEITAKDKCKAQNIQSTDTNAIAGVDACGK